MRLHIFILRLSLLVPALMRADFSDDVSYISKECLTALHYDHIKSSLLVFAKSHNLSDEEMAKRLLFIANPSNGFTNCVGCSQTQAALGAICFFRNAKSALPELEKYMLCSNTSFRALCAYGYITRYDNHFFTFVRTAIGNGKINKNIVLSQLYSAVNNPDSETWKTSPKSRLRIYRLILDCQADDFDSLLYSDRFIKNVLFGYTNSVEHVQTQKKLLSLLNDNREKIVNSSFYRGEWGGGNVSNEEWYRMATNSCQSEIARVMALPESQRVSMTAILDAQIAAIEEVEARAARRAIWRRRIRNAVLLLPVLVFVVLLARRKTR